MAQILTCDTTSTPARLVHLLRCRWRIENAFKYLAAHNGIDSLCDYTMDTIPDQRSVANPERVAARTALNTLKAAVAATEQALGATLASLEHGPDKLAALRHLSDVRAMIIDEIEQAETELRTHRATITRNDLDPTATRALPRLHGRGLQMVRYGSVTSVLIGVANAS